MPNRKSVSAMNKNVVNSRLVLQMEKLRMKQSYEKIDEHIQWLMDFMKEDFPIGFEMVITSDFAEIRSTLATTNFMRNDLKTPEGFRKECGISEESITDFLKKIVPDSDSNS